MTVTICCISCLIICSCDVVDLWVENHTPRYRSNSLGFAAWTVVGLLVPIVTEGFMRLAGGLTTINLDLSPLISMSFRVKKLFEMSIIRCRLAWLCPIHSVSSANASPATLVLMARTLFCCEVGHDTSVIYPSDVSFLIMQSRGS